MCIRTARTVCGRLAWIGLLAALLATLAVPSTRELQTLLVRLLFHIEGANTYVQGQPPGCVIVVVPNVQFRQQYLDKVREESATSPEAFLRAVSCLWAHQEMPTVEHWESDPLLVWATFEQVSHTVRPRYPQVVDIPLDTEAARSDRAGTAWTFVRCAQDRRPENGALWLAEAALHFFDGRQESALQALDTAADKPAWDSQKSESILLTAHLLEADGLPRFDALVRAWSRSRPNGRYVASYVREQLFTVIADAVAEGDDTRFAILAGQLHRLQGGTWAIPGTPNFFRAWPDRYYDPDMAAAMAARLGIAVPAAGEIEYEQARTLHDAIVAEYLQRHLDHQLAGGLLDSQSKHRNERRNRPNHHPTFYPGIRSTIGGLLVMLLFAFGISALLLELPFWLEPRSFIVRRDGGFPRSRRVRAAVCVACLGVILVLFRLIDSLQQPTGFGAAPTEELLSPSQSNFLGAAALGFFWTVLRLLIRGTGWLSTCYNIGLLLLGFAYLAAVALTAHFREETIRVIEELIRHVGVT
ncbi:MAG: hypothetical protein GY778_10005 [bacterium]|nr:hypothetical protein [bacterium]